MDIQFVKICAILCGGMIIIAICIYCCRQRRGYRSIDYLPNPYYQQHTHRSVTFESPFLEEEEGGPADNGGY